MQTLIEDLHSDLDKVERSYIRVPVALFLTPIFFMFLLVAGIILSIIETFKSTWKDWLYPLL